MSVSLDSRNFRERVTGVMLQFSPWMTTSRSVKGEVQQDLTSFLETDATVVSSTSKIFDTQHEIIQNLAALRSQATTHYRQRTLPYLMKGVRLVNRTRYAELLREMTDGPDSFRTRIKLAEADLQRRRDEVIEAARAKLGPRLFNPSVYPATFVGCFDLTFEPVNIEVPSYLMELDPQEYARRVQELDTRCSQSFALYDEQLGVKFVELIEHLSEQLKPGEDGNKKRFHSSAVTNVQDFFGAYASMKQSFQDMPWNQDVAAAVDRAVAVLAENDLDAVKASQSIRTRVDAAFTEIRQSLEKFVVTATRRKVVRKSVESSLESSAPSEEAVHAE